ncbi:MAG: response regulator [Bdellovibrionales bacterium]|nr:response regulator [Bdellovibrionales bacterium]
MALRVLLADESSTIKKVFQLALQDFAVDVRPVNIGLDVVPVAQKFKPDIIFADVMLQKRSGYEVAAEIKQHAELNGIPVVLMWSGFVELDEDKFQASHANAQLEKPFDVTALRKLVTDLVPRTQNQRLSQFLAFPPMPEIEDKAPAATSTAATETPPLPDEDFKQVSIPKMKGAADKYRVNLKPEELESDHLPVDYKMPTEKIDVEDIFSTAEAEEEDEQFAIKETRRSPQAATATPPPTPAPQKFTPPPAMDELTPVPKVATPSAHTAPSLSAEQLEKIIREQSAEVIESVVWKVVPDLAAQIIERELNRLLKERDAQAY